MAKSEVRIDKWLWAVRIFKTRTIATEAIKKGRVTMGDNPVPVKPSRMLKVGDTVNVRKPPVTYYGVDRHEPDDVDTEVTQTREFALCALEITRGGALTQIHFIDNGAVHKLRIGSCRTGRHGHRQGGERRDYEFFHIVRFYRSGFSCD